MSTILVILEYTVHTFDHPVDPFEDKKRRLLVWWQEVGERDRKGERGEGRLINYI